MKIISPIILLLFLRCPTDVAWLVMTIVVHPVKRMLRGRFSAYFRNKFIDRCESKLNATTSVIGVSALFGIVTSLFSRIVASELWRDFFLSAFAVSNRVLTFSFFLKASARANVSGSEVARADRRTVSTGACALPADLATGRPVTKTNYGQTMETLSGQIFEIVRFQAFTGCHNA
jgi:hypothetical protein